MLESYRGWINQNGFDETTTGVNHKFNQIIDRPLGPSLKLDLIYVNAYGRPIRASEYNTTSRPLSSITVNKNTITTLQRFNGYGAGFSSYTNFMNAIMQRHGLNSRFWSMGPANPSDSGPLGIVCNLSLTEEFALTFVETPTNINNFTSSFIYHIETMTPMSVRSYVDRVEGGFGGLKSNIESAIINGIWIRSTNPVFNPVLPNP